MQHFQQGVWFKQDPHVRMPASGATTQILLKGAMVSSLSGDVCLVDNSVSATPGFHEWIQFLGCAALICVCLGYCCGCASAIALMRRRGVVATRNERVQGPVTYARRRTNPRYLPLGEHEWGSWSE